MTRKLLLLFAGFSIVASACGGGAGAAGRDERLVNAAIDRMDRTPRRFLYRELTPDQRVIVRGVEADDLRYTGSLALDGEPLFDAVVSDDALALKLTQPQAAGPVAAAAAAEDDVSGEALSEGKWVLDPQGAPPLVPEGLGRESGVQVGANPFLDVVYLKHYLDQAVDRAGGVGRWNPEDIEYNPLDDPWRDDADRNLNDQGIRRYDVFPPPLPRRSERGSLTALPGPEHFRKMAFYLRGDRLIEIREQIDFEDRREFRRAEQGRAAQYYLELLENARAGATRQPVRERLMQYRLDYGDVAVQTPPDAVPGVLKSAIGQRGLASLFEPPPAPRGLPGLPGQRPASDDAVPGQTPDAEAQQSLRNALTAAKTVYTENQTYLDATAANLQRSEPTLQFSDDGVSNGPREISVRPVDDQQFVAAAKSESGTCFALLDVAQDGPVLAAGTYFAARSEGECRASLFESTDFSEGGWRS